MRYTQLPIPKWVNHHPSYLSKATKYQPLIGWLVASLAGLTLWLTSFLLPFSVSLLLSMAVSIIATGAFHENGFANTCAGFGESKNQERILEIIQSSKISIFSSIGLILLLMGKYIALSEIGPRTAILALFIAHPLSRLATVITRASSQYVQQNDQNITKPNPKLKTNDLLLAGFFGLLPLLIWGSWLQIALAIPLVLLTRWLLARVFQKWIGGYTENTLGAIQQLSEFIIYISLLIKIPMLFE